MHFFRRNETNRSQFPAETSRIELLRGTGLLLVAWRPEGAATVVSIVFRAIITGGFALGMSRIIITVILSIEKLLVRPAVSKCRRDIRSWQDEKQQRQSRREADEASRLKQLEWERRAPERQRAAEESAAKARRDAKVAAEKSRQAAENQKRREDARAGCEFLYAQHKPEINRGFTQKQFDAFVARYLSDQYPAEYVEQRAEQLKGLIQEHYQKKKPAEPRFKSLSEISDWYEQQRANIEQITNPDFQEELLVKLETEYSELMTRFMEQMIQ